MKHFLLVSLFLCIAFVGCQSAEVSKNTSKLDESKLTLPKYDASTKINPKVYEPVSLQKAKEAIPFTPKLPSSLPKEYEPIQVNIEDWGAKKKIALEMKIIPNKANIDQLAIYSLRIANFSDFASDFIKKKEYEKEIQLQNGVTAYYKNGQLAWIEKNIEYLIGLIDHPNKQNTQQSENLVIEFANSLK